MLGYWYLGGDLTTRLDQLTIGQRKGSVHAQIFGPVPSLEKCKLNVVYVSSKILK